VNAACVEVEHIFTIRVHGGMHSSLFIDARLTYVQSPSG
jgi:hypothetical protein